MNLDAAAVHSRPSITRSHALGRGFTGLREPPVRPGSGGVRGAVLALAMGLALGGCRPSAPPTDPGRPEEISSQLVPSDRLGEPFMARQRVVATHRGRRHAFEAVLQYDGRSLVLLALTPMGTKAFLLRQEGTNVAYEPFVDQTLPFPPQYILLDVHRTLFDGLPGAPLPDGKHVAKHRGDRLVEVWRDGRLFERTYQHRGRPGRGGGVISISYRGGMVPGQPPPTIDFDNQRFGYTLTIETISHQGIARVGPR